MKEVLAIIILAIGLSMDSLTVSLAASSTNKKIESFVSFRFAITLGLIQAVFTIAGWAGGSELVKYFAEIDHWIAFGLLLLIGGKMLYDGIFQKDSESKSEINMNNFFVVTGLGVATSIDAAVVGVSMSFAGLNIWLSSLIIMIVTFLFSYFGLLSGNVIKTRLKKFPIEIIGGFFLIGIGVRTLIIHITQGI